MTAGRFVLSHPARSDLDEIWDFIAKDHVSAADRWVDHLVSRLQLLADTPTLGRRRSEVAPDLRSFPVGRYVVFYRLRREHIDIVRILHGSRDLPALFREE